MGPLGESFASDERVVLLIDEIDKADVEFPNDLLHELDAMSFTIPETGDTVKAKHRPIVVITSNSERELPDAFLRRAVFHYIAFPDQALMSEIVQVHFPDIGADMLEGSLRSFYRLRGVEGLRKKPSTSELIDWIAALISSGFAPTELDENTPFLGTLIKREQDLDVLQRNRHWH
jgi:MoxR-like ATPase